jgi:hypothetical protein
MLQMVLEIVVILYLKSSELTKDLVAHYLSS